MTDADKKLLELADKATPRPWVAWAGSGWPPAWAVRLRIPEDQIGVFWPIRENNKSHDDPAILGAVSSDDQAYVVAAANAVPRLIDEKEALLKRIERLRNVMHDQVIEFSEPSAKTEAIRKKWAMNVLAADDAAAKEQADD